ncbi:MAG: oxygen-independent coproporphyrinogen III oxidase-like protein [Aromatoleum sp.]|nr:oxygen-independent coproporphyrinogen III oxidase-like protein [Aromatoleum sp.]
MSTAIVGVVDAGALTGPHFAALPPLALYVHIPWCLKKCPYCDFNSHEAHGEAPEDAYVDALFADLEWALPSIWGRKVVTVFIGGGTPSLFSAAAIDRLLAGMRARVPLSPDAEVTLEANPGTFEREKFAGFSAAGVNRLSIGIQSFNPQHLRSLGRVHDADEARRAADAGLAIFGNVNFDLMYALPEQTVADAEADLAQALAFAPPHLSFYHLTLEPNTLFHRYPPRLPDDEVTADIEDAVEATLAAAGYVHYETSAHARPGRQGRHNLNYWQFGDYLGIGAGAHSKLSFANRIVRQVRHKQPKQYLEQVAAGAPLQENTEVSRADTGFEFMLNALRLADGVPATLFAERTGYPLSLVQRQLADAAERGLVAIDPTVIRPTALGRRFLNDLQALFLAETPREPPAVRTQRIDVVERRR